MRQFIRKNRKKRQYIRRQKVVKKPQIKHEKKIPKVIVHSPIQKSLPKVQKIKINKSYTLPKFTVPSFSRKLFVYLIGIFSMVILSYLLPFLPMDALFNNVSDIITTLSQAVIIVISWVIDVGAGIMWLLGESIKGLIWIVSGVYNGLLIALYFLWQLLVVLADGIMTILQVLYSLLMQIITFLWFVISTVAVAIFNALIYMWNGFVHHMSRFIYWVGTPFRHLWAFGVSLQPYFAIFGQHVQSAFDVLRDGMKSLSSFGSIK